jgi:hypothetical protein
MALEFKKSRFLLCEGDDDKGFLETLIQQHNLPDFQVCQAAECNEKKQGGRSGFRYSLDSGIRVLSGFAQLRAILIVSDNDKQHSFREVQDELTAAGIAPPNTAGEAFVIFGKPAAVLLVPTANYGDLESLCLPEIHRVWPLAPQCVESFMRCTGADLWQKAASVNKARARAATVGFYEPDPYKGLGHHFRIGTFTTGNPCFQPIVDFLRGFDALVGI